MYIDRIRINWDKVSEDSYLTRIPAIGLLQELSFRKPVTFFVGENGTGKSTLLEAIAIAYGFNPEGGTLNYNFSTHDDYSELCDALTIAQGAAKGRRGGFFLRAESFYNVSTKAIEYEKGIRYLEYEETESYRITEMMINHRDLMVSQLLQE